MALNTDTNRPKSQKVNTVKTAAGAENLTGSVHPLKASPHRALLLSGLLAGLSFSGCDFWPPSLHDQIEELQMTVIKASGEIYRLNKDNAQLRQLQTAMQQEMKEKEQDNEVLKKQLAALGSQTKRLAEEKPAIPASVSLSQPTIQKGSYVFLQVRHPPMTGPRIARIQRLLQNHGLPIRVDAVYGQETATAVRDFQGYQGLVADGVVGPATERAFHHSARSSKVVRQRSLQNPPRNRRDLLRLQ